MSIETELKRLLKTPLYQFQIQGIQFLEDCNGRALNGMDMGLGKTIQAIAWLALHPEALPAIVVCPSAVKIHWQRQFRLHAEMDSMILNGRKPEIPPGKIWIVNYDILHSWAETLRECCPQTIIVDECHYVKNRKALRTKAFQSLARNCKHILALSGTPIISRPVEFFPVLQTISPKLFPSFWKYAFRYCNPKRGYQGRGWDFRGASHTEELHRLVSQIMIRRMKSEVLKELPPKTRTIIPVEITNRKEYEFAKDNFLEWLSDKEGEESVNRARKGLDFVKLGKLKHIVAQGKIPSIKEWVDEFLEESKDQKLVVFAVHRDIISSIHDFYPEAGIIDGTVSGEERQKAVDRFQSDPTCRILIGSIGAAGTGIELTAASTVLFAEIGWTPAEHDQAEDRVLRIGQTAKHVDIYYITGNDTLEDRILSLIERKRKIVGQVLDGKEPSAWLLKDLFPKL